MRVNRLELTHYRNLSPTVLEPGPGVNVIWGENAQGKTNLLEAVWLFTGGKSFRGARDSELTAFGEDESTLTMDFTAQDREQRARLTIRNRRSAVLNGVSLTGASQLAGRFCGIVFSPAHLTLVKGGPEERRRFLDAAYCQLRPGYMKSLSEYSRALAQRNTLLKDLRSGRGLPGWEELLEVWDQRLAQSGCRLMQARLRYIDRLGPVAAEIYGGLSGGREAFSLEYETSLPEPVDGNTPAADLAALFYKALRNARDADLAAGFTTVGPHRDDAKTAIGGLSARMYGSQGQQRSAVLALKMAEATLLREVTGEQPVALLDDVMSELDQSRQDYILNHIGDWQVFITCCDPDPLRRMDGGQEFHMKQGRLV